MSGIPPQIVPASWKNEDLRVADVMRVLDQAGLTNPPVREYVSRWAQITGAERIEVVSAADDARLIRESLEAGEILPAGEGLYYSRSYQKDTARSEERTIVATSRPQDAGAYNNWRPAQEMKLLLEGLMTGASAGKTMYVVPYLMALPDGPARVAAGAVGGPVHRTARGDLGGSSPSDSGAAGILTRTGGPPPPLVRDQAISS